MNLDEIKGVGPKTLKLLNKLGIYNGYDLICYYPFRYVVVKRTDFYFPGTFIFANIIL